jgi:hypothetical protein
MKFSTFYDKYSGESECKEKFRQIREQEGICCKKCKGKDHYWKSDKWQWQCKSCGFRTTLRSGTVMESSKLPYRYWFAAMHFLTVNKKSFSAKSIQEELGHKRYEPIWAMLHKLRIVMGVRDAKYQLTEWIELDEGFFEQVRNTETIENKDIAPVEEKKPAEPKRGRGSEKQSKVLVAVESNPETADKKDKKHNKGRKAGHLKMIVMDDLTKKGINYEIIKGVDKNTVVETDGYPGYAGLNEIVKEHKVTVMVNPKKAEKVFPWVHTAISNAKRLLLGVFHRIDGKYLQNYLNEYCYRFNRRYMKEAIFDRLLIAAVSYTSYGYEKG